MLPYDVVIATRNRPHALSISIPLMLAQRRPPNKVIVVDSSDDHQAARAAVEVASRGRPVRCEVVRSERGLTLQRNVALSLVESPVTFFPDDDSIWFPGVAEEVMRVYELDTRGDIGGVCTAESPTPPPGVFGHARRAYRMSRRDRVRQLIAHQRSALERALTVNPFIVHGRSRWGVRPPPPWLVEEEVVLVEYMTGFRMSFRTELIRRFGFDESLRGYGLCEDIDASFQVMRTHLVVGARRARVFHYKSPERRTSGLSIGVSQILNRAYVLFKHAPPGSPARRRLRPYAAYKIAQYLARLNSPYGRDRLSGAWRALRRLDVLGAAPAEDLSRRYLELRDQCLAGDGQP